MQAGCLLTLLDFSHGNGATCGAWGSSHPPLTPLPPSPLQNMPNVRDHDASVYLRLQGDALSVGGYESNPIFWEEVSTPRGGAGGFTRNSQLQDGCRKELLVSPLT